MKQFMKSFVNGVVTILPILLVIYVTLRVFDLLDGILGQVYERYLPFYIPGIGLLTSILFIALLGWLSERYIFGGLFHILDRTISRIPLIKSVYSITKETFHSLVGEKKSFSKVVLVNMGDSDMKVLGFVTSEDLHVLGEAGSDKIAVYIPQTFQIAGFTFLIPKEQVEFLDISPEAALKFVMSGGMANAK